MLTSKVAYYKCEDCGEEVPIGQHLEEETGRVMGYGILEVKNLCPECEGEMGPEQVDVPNGKLLVFGDEVEEH